MDIYTEQLVKTKKRGITVLLQILIWLVGIAVSGALLILYTISGGLLEKQGVFLMIFLQPLSMIASVICLYFTWFLSSLCNIEYEYIHTNKDFDIDKIISKRRRRRLITVNCDNVESMGVFTPEILQKTTAYDKKLFCHGYSDSSPYYLIARTVNHGRVLIIFSPDEQTLEGLKKSVPKTVLK